MSEASTRDDAAPADGAGKAARSKPPCFAFQKGECSRGDACRFEHGAAAAAGTGAEEAEGKR